MIANTKKAGGIGELDPAAAAITRISKKVSKRNSALPPGSQVISTPNGREVIPPADVRNYGGSTLSKVSLNKLVRHPDNRHPTQAAIDKMADSIKANGQLEPIVVRRISGDNWEIISGETRVLARRELYGNKGECEAHVLNDCSDARALELLAIYNADRTDLNAIEKAQMIKRLCDPILEGGSDMTREQAAKIYGLETGAAASNLVRLLELPKVWQDRIASGEFPQTFARLLVPYVHAPRIMEAIDKHYVRDMSGRNHSRDKWEGRDSVERKIDWIIGECTRPLDKKSTHYYHYESFKGKSEAYHFTGQHPCLFELTPEIESQLDVVELGDTKKAIRVATNCQAYDKLQIPAIIKHVTDSSKKKSNASAGEKKSKSKALSPAELKRKSAEQKRHLENRVDEWRHRWIADLVLEQMLTNQKANLAAAKYMLLWATADKAFDGSTWDPKSPESVLDKQLEGSIDFDKLIVSYVQSKLQQDASDRDGCKYPVEVIDRLAVMLAVDVVGKWAQLSTDRLETLLLAHQKDQLDVFAKEWDVYFKETLGKTERIKLLLASSNRRKLPKCIKPLAIAGGKKKRK